MKGEHNDETIIIQSLFAECTKTIDELLSSGKDIKRDSGEILAAAVRTLKEAISRIERPTPHDRIRISVLVKVARYLRYLEDEIDEMQIDNEYDDLGTHEPAPTLVALARSRGWDRDYLQYEHQRHVRYHEMIGILRQLYIRGGKK